MSHGLDTRITMLGDLTHWYHHPISLYFDNITVGSFPYSDQRTHRVRSIVIAHHIPRNTSWDMWYQESTKTHQELDFLLPAMDDPSTILTIGHSTSERSQERRNARTFLRKLVNGIRSHTRHSPAEGVSVNGIELPPSANHLVMARRLIRFLHKTPLAADNNVIRYENIHDYSIKAALTAFEL